MSFIHTVKKGENQNNAIYFCSGILKCVQTYLLKQDLIICCQSLSHSYGEQFRLLLNIYQDVFQELNGACKHNFFYYWGVLEANLQHTLCEYKNHLSNLGVYFHLPFYCFLSNHPYIDFLHGNFLNKKRLYSFSFGEQQTKLHRLYNVLKSLVSSYIVFYRLKVYCLRFYNRLNKMSHYLFGCLSQKNFFCSKDRFYQSYSLNYYGL